MRPSPIALAACFLAAASAPALPEDVHSSISDCGLEGEMRVEQRGERAFMIVYLNPDADYEKVASFSARHIGSGSISVSSAIKRRSAARGRPPLAKTGWGRQTEQRERGKPGMACMGRSRIVAYGAVAVRYPAVEASMGSAAAEWAPLKPQSPLHSMVRYVSAGGRIDMG